MGVTMLLMDSTLLMKMGGVVGGVGGSNGDAARDAEGEAVMEDGLVADFFLDGVGDDLDTELEDDDFETGLDAKFALGVLEAVGGDVFGTEGLGGAAIGFLWFVEFDFEGGDLASDSLMIPDPFSMCLVA